MSTGTGANASDVGKSNQRAAIAGDINGVQMLIAAIAASMPTSSTGIHVRAFSCSVPYERQKSHVLPSSA